MTSEENRLDSNEWSDPGFLTILLDTFSSQPKGYALFETNEKFYEVFGGSNPNLKSDWDRHLGIYTRIWFKGAQSIYIFVSLYLLGFLLVFTWVYSTVSESTGFWSVAWIVATVILGFASGYVAAALPILRLTRRVAATQIPIHILSALADLGGDERTWVEKDRRRVMQHLEATARSLERCPHRLTAGSATLQKSVQLEFDKKAAWTRQLALEVAVPDTSTRTEVGKQLRSMFPSALRQEWARLDESEVPPTVVRGWRGAIRSISVIVIVPITVAIAFLLNQVTTQVSIPQSWEPWLVLLAVAWVVLGVAFTAKRELTADMVGGFKALIGGPPK